MCRVSLLCHHVVLSEYFVVGMSMIQHMFSGYLYMRLKASLNTQNLVLIVTACEISKILQVHFPFSLHHTQSHEGSGEGIVSLINMPIEDLEDEIKHGIKHDVETQKEFEADMTIVNI